MGDLPSVLHCRRPGRIPGYTLHLTLSPGKGSPSAATKMRKDLWSLVLPLFLSTSFNCVSADFRALTQESPVVVAVGDVAVFTCRTSFPYALKEVRWIRNQGDRKYLINVFHAGKDQQRCDLPEYVGRTELIKEDLARGRAALKLFNASVADEGAYRCYLQTEDYFDYDDLEMRVTAQGSKPSIDIEGFQDGGLKLVCRSAGWYPKPVLVTKDDDGKVEIQKERNGLFSIQYSRVITENSNRTFTCTLQTQFPHQEHEVSVYAADDLFLRSTDTNVHIIIHSIFLLLLLLLLAAAVILGTRTRRWKNQGTAGVVVTDELPLKVSLQQDSNICA